MDVVELEAAMTDVRKAQRLLVAYHQRILPLIEGIADQLGCAYHYWGPLHHGTAPWGKSNPFRRWAWDFAPLDDANFFFLSEPFDSALVRPEGWMLVIRLVTDSGLANAFTTKKVNWDVMDISSDPTECETRLELYAYKPRRSYQDDWGWWKLYSQNDWPKENGGHCELEQDGFVFRHDVPVSRLGSTDAVQGVVAEYKALLTSRQVAEFD
ncbi:hypothetical protein [Motiliproteus sp. SC1-56]|uniref:hypothetical protein n=1 Tax=Motiliproteus sp. SC1-56 TaxID=2799565 RepID=UPI001A9020D9|nr:hypothetical protein [Motiliproteus sp. SC1-56]